MNGVSAPHQIPDERYSCDNLRAPLIPHEAAFSAAERATVTILFGGLTWKHERLIEGLLAGAGYLCQKLPETDRAAHELGKEFCASGLCNPVYFTVGNLIRFLEEKHKAGLPREEIVCRFVYFTAACGGPCRFGMYESEFRVALNAAGYVGFRVLSFSQDHGIRASTGHSGLQFSVDFGMNALHSFILGDLLNSTQHRLRPYEVRAGATDQAIARMTEMIAAALRSAQCVRASRARAGLSAASRHLSGLPQSPNTPRESLVAFVRPRAHRCSTRGSQRTPDR